MSEVELRLTADLDQATKEVAGFRKEYQDMVKTVEKPLRQVTQMRDFERTFEATGKTVRGMREELKGLQSELIKTENPSLKLKTQYRDLASELQRLERVEARQANQLGRMRSELNAAGIDTSKLAIEQRRLNAEMNAGLAAGRSDAAATAAAARNAAAVAGIRERSAALSQQAREQRVANLEAARQDLGVNRYRQLQAQLVQVRSQYQLLRSSGRLSVQELAVAQRTMTLRVRETQRALREMNAEQARARGVGGLTAGIGGAIGVLGAGYAAVSAISGIAKAADAYGLMAARLRLATESQEEFTTAQTELGRIAQQTETPVQSLVTLYGRIARPLREAGRSQQDILRVTEAVSTSFRVSGATAQEAESGVIQFAQALGAGALRGDEFNSVAEQAPRLMQALADGIGVPVAALKTMAAQGELTAEIVTDALTGQLETLRREAEALPSTVGGAMTKLADRWREAVGKADVQPLIDSINKLGETLSDPVVVDNLVRLASALATLAGGAVGASSDFVDMGKQIAFIAAKSQGLVTELDAIDNELAAVNKSLDDSWSPGDLLTDLFFSKEELEAKRDALIAMRESIIEQQTGLNAEMRAESERAAAEAEALRNTELSDYREYIGKVDTLRRSQIKAAEEGAKQLVSAEKKALSELDKVRGDRLKIEQRYQEALAGMRGGGKASYGNAQALRVGAEQALRAGDIAGAQRQAQAALKMLQDLAAAGENTYGFEGFIKSLQAIELAANDIERGQAEKKLEDIRAEMKSLKDQAAALKDMPVSVKTDDAQLEQVRSAIEALITQLGQKEIVLPVRLAMPDGLGVNSPTASLNELPVPQLWRGGYTGPGGRYEPAGVVHKGEVVWSQLDIARAGGVAVVEAMRRGKRGYDMGGVVGGSLPSIPTLAPALQQQLQGPGFPDLGRVVFEAGGEQVTVYASPQEGANLKRLAMKFGGGARR